MGVVFGFYWLTVRDGDPGACGQCHHQVPAVVTELASSALR
jgi:hypothetical protein